MSSRPDRCASRRPGPPRAERERTIGRIRELRAAEGVDAPATEPPQWGGDGTPGAAPGNLASALTPPDWQEPCIEPLFALAYRRQHSLGGPPFVEINPIFQRYVAEHRLDNAGVLEHVLTTGHLGGLPGIPDAIRELLSQPPS